MWEISCFIEFIEISFSFDFLLKKKKPLKISFFEVELVISNFRYYLNKSATFEYRISCIQYTTNYKFVNKYV